MLERLTYTKKLYLLLLTFVCLSVFAYKYSIKRTIDLTRKSAILEKRIESSKSADVKVQFLRTELNQLESLIGKGRIGGNEAQSLLLDRVNSYCASSKTELIEVFPIHYYSENNYAISTNSFKVSGDFISLLKLNEELEKRFGEARVSAVHYEREENLRTKRKKLYATFYIQNISEV